MYTGCWLALALYVLTTVAAFRRPSGISCAVSFLSACILWLHLTIFNVWFFMPAFIYHIRESHLQADSIGGFFEAIVTSEPAKDIYLVGLGSCEYTLDYSPFTSYNIAP